MFVQKFFVATYCVAISSSNVVAPIYVVLKLVLCIEFQYMHVSYSRLVTDIVLRFEIAIYKPKNHKNFG